MSQIFHPSMNVIARVGLLVIVLLLVGVAWLGMTIARSPYTTQVGVAKAQPIPFSHKQHVGGLGMDCRYCHTSVETSSSASIPSTETCMGCHAQVAKESPLLEALRASYETDKPLEWVRVHDLPDYVYFNHAIHVKKGVGCETCHGRIDQMPVVAKAKSLQMDWCLECHRNPEPFLRPPSAVFTMGWQPPADPISLANQGVGHDSLHANSLTDCSVCHR